MRLIDADALEQSGIPFATHGGGCFIALGSLRTATTIDAVPVVRCKDCKNYRQNQYGEAGEMMCMCWVDWLPTAPDDFCSYGERKDGEG